MRFGSLFAGIGGLDLGLERAGLECAWQVEWDDYCQRVLAKHWPDVPRFGDVRDVGAHNLEPVDLIVGGFPCQPVSDAGRREAQADDRWLWPEFARLLRELRPRYAIVENVPGLLTTQQGRAAQEVFGDLAALGFDARWRVIPASAVGAPHRRDRVFAVAWTDVADPKGQPIGSGLREGGSPRFGRGRPSDGGGSHSSAWPVEPAVGRVAYGVPDRVDRLSALGNAVVPQVAEWVGRRIVDFDARRNA